MDVLESKTLPAVIKAYIEATEAVETPACFVDRHGNIFAANRSLESLLGMSDALNSKKIFEINPAMSILSWREFWLDINAKKQAEDVAMLMKQNGDIFEIAYQAKLLITNQIECCSFIFKYQSSSEATSDQLDVTTKMIRHTMAHAKEMVFWIDEEGNLVYFNEILVKKTGYSKEELKRMKAWDFSPSVKNKSEWAAFITTVKEAGEFVLETEQIRKDGTINIIETINNYVEFEGKAYIFSIVLDITQQKKRDELLYKMKYSFDFANEMIAWYNPEGSILYANSSLAEACGYELEELNHLSIWNLAPNVTKENWITEYWEQFKEGKVPLYETVMQKKTGEVFPIEVSATYLQYNGNEYLLAVAKNIKERKAKEVRLERTVEQLEKLRSQLEDERNYLKQEITVSNNFNEIITKNKKYKKVLYQIQQVADTDATVLILGETGTGKELIARAVHNLSDREDQPLIKVNCAAIPANLIESELFGHEKGAFTSAYKKKIGRFERAHLGSIFLDEIGEMPLELQSKLLRVLQEGEFERLGSTEIISVDVRVIAATNRDLKQRVAEGKFREDLYYRLNVFPIYNTPLRERKDDILPLVNHFLRKYCKKLGRPLLKVNQAGIKELHDYDFPGNIRELENLVERAIIISRGEVLNLHEVLPKKQSSSTERAGQSDFLSLEEMQRQHILDALSETNWKVTGKDSAAELLKMNGKTLASKMRKMNIRKEDFLSI